MIGSWGKMRFTNISQFSKVTGLKIRGICESYIFPQISCLSLCQLLKEEAATLLTTKVIDVTFCKNTDLDFTNKVV